MIKDKISTARRVALHYAAIHIAAYACGGGPEDDRPQPDEAPPGTGGAGHARPPHAGNRNEAAKGGTNAVSEEGEGGAPYAPSGMPQASAGSWSAGEAGVGGSGSALPAGAGGVESAIGGNAGSSEEEPAEEGGAPGAPAGGDTAGRPAGVGGEMASGGQPERGDGGVGGEVAEPEPSLSGRGGGAGSAAIAGGGGDAGKAGSGGQTSGPLPVGDVGRGGEIVADYNCAGCHGSDLGGRSYFRNITPDPLTGIGEWSDDEIARGIRNGKNKLGETLCVHMPHYPWPNQKVADVIAYLRWIPAKVNSITSVCSGHGS